MRTVIPAEPGYRCILLDPGAVHGEEATFLDCRVLAWDIDTERTHMEDGDHKEEAHVVLPITLEEGVTWSDHLILDPDEKFVTFSKGGNGYRWVNGKPLRHSPPTQGKRVPDPKARKT